MEIKNCVRPLYGKRKFTIPLLFAVSKGTCKTKPYQDEANILAVLISSVK